MTKQAGKKEQKRQEVQRWHADTPFGVTMGQAAAATVEKYTRGTHLRA